MSAVAPRLLFVTHAYPRFPTDAAGSFLHRLSLALRAAGCEIRVLAPSGEGLPAASEIDGIPVRRFRYAPKGMESLSYEGSLIDQVAGSLRGKGALAGLLAAGSVALNRAIDEFAPDIVHAQWWFPAGLLALAGAGDARLVTTLHGSDLRLARRFKFLHPVLRRVLRRSDAVTAVSSWLAGETRAISTDVPLSVIPTPADLTLFSGTRVPRIPGRFLFVGRLEPGCGLDCLLEALAWCGSTASLDIVGVGKEEAGFLRVAERLGVAERVRWLGAVPRHDLPAIYARSQSLVACGAGPRQGGAVVEAQLSRTPVIACRTGVLPEVVSHEWGGRLVTRGDVRALADALRSVLDAPELVDAQGASARARMVDRLAPTAVAARYTSLYRSLLRDVRE